MPLETMEAILQLGKQGATIVWAGKKPHRCPGLTGYPECDNAMKQAAEALWTLPNFTHFENHDYHQLVPLLEASDHPPSWKTDGDRPLRFVHRRTENRDIFFVVNRSGHPVSTRVLFRVPGRVPQLWDPVSGEKNAVPYEAASDSVRIMLDLPGFGSTFIVFGKNAVPLPKKLAYSEEILSIEGPWTLSFPEGYGAPKKVELDALRSWTDFEKSGIQHFSGTATYTTEFDVSKPPPQDAALDLGGVRQVCEVMVNGTRAGVAWHAPYRINVSGLLVEGKNLLEIRVANLWHNRIVGDAEQAPEDRVTRMVPVTHYESMKGKELVPSGLLGPVRIVAALNGD